MTPSDPTMSPESELVLTAAIERIHRHRDGCNGRPHRRGYRGENKCETLARLAAQSPVQPVLSGLDQMQWSTVRDMAERGLCPVCDNEFRVAGHSFDCPLAARLATAPPTDEGLREAIEDIAGKVYYVGNVDGHEVARRLRAALANPATPKPEQDRCTCPPDDEVFTAGCPVHDEDLR